VTVAVAVCQCWGGGVEKALVVACVDDPVPLVAMASFWNALNEWGSGSAGALIAKTIP
jgi:hypothetical protein